MSEAQRMQEEADRKRRAEREAEMNAAESQGGLMKFFEAILGLLFDFIFGEDPNAPHESLEDSQPASMSDKVQTARTVISSGALEKWKAFKQEHAGERAMRFIQPKQSGRDSSLGFDLRLQRFGRH